MTIFNIKITEQTRTPRFSFLSSPLGPTIYSATIQFSPAGGPPKGLLDAISGNEISSSQVCLIFGDDKPIRGYVGHIPEVDGAVIAESATLECQQGEANKFYITIADKKYDIELADANASLLRDFISEYNAAFPGAKIVNERNVSRNVR